MSTNKTHRLWYAWFFCAGFATAFEIWIWFLR